MKWLKAHGIDDAAARAQWAKGFEGWWKFEDLYTVAQHNGWRYPVAQNLNRLDEMVERVEGALVRVGVDLYQSGGKLVRPVSVLVDATKGRKTRIADSWKSKELSSKPNSVAMLISSHGRKKSKPDWATE